MITQINEFKIQDDFEVFSSDFSGLRKLYILIDLSSLCNLTGLKLDLGFDRTLLRSMLLRVLSMYEAILASPIPKS